MTGDTYFKALTFLDSSHDEPEMHELNTGICAVFSRRCPGKDTPNEDAAAIIPARTDSCVLAVADGCGGMAGGERAARLAVEMLVESVANVACTDAPLRMAILDGIEKANRRVRKMGTGAGTTISAVEISAHRIRPYHVGDSIVLLVGNRGKVKLQTHPHSPVGYAVAAGVIDERDAIHHDERHLVSNVVGTHDTHIEIGPYRQLAPRDTLLIASDGLTDNLHVDEIVGIIRKGDLAVAARRLASISCERMSSPTAATPSKPDDLTFIIYRSC